MSFAHSYSYLLCDENPILKVKLSLYIDYKILYRKDLRESVLVRVFIAVRRHHDLGNSHKENIKLGFAYIFRG